MPCFLKWRWIRSGVHMYLKKVVNIVRDSRTRIKNRIIVLFVCVVQLFACERDEIDHKL